VAGSVVEAEWPVTTNAEMCFRQSIRIAQQQKAKSIELRAVVSMGRLLQNQSKREEARAFVAQIYDKFTEGFDTSDLRAAKALLAELS
jgi:predicted ATPase